MVTGQSSGHPIVFDGSVWRYRDSGQIVNPMVKLPDPQRSLFERLAAQLESVINSQIPPWSRR